MALLSNINFYFDCKTRLCLAGKRKYIFAQESFYLQGILDDINEQDTSFVDCKHKHMMKSGAPPDKFAVLYQTEFFLIKMSEYLTEHQLYRPTILGGAQITTDLVQIICLNPK